MDITSDLVKHLANLSRLNFSNLELENFKHEFEKTMQQIETINKANTKDIILKPRVLSAKTDLRSDEVKSGLTREQVIKNAPENLGGSIVVPTVVEQEWITQNLVF